MLELSEIGLRAHRKIIGENLDSAVLAFKSCNDALQYRYSVYHKKFHVI